jgi:NAD(P)-dependent dehydrogenase (short-subunit alcohol dehydrogenase family)
VTDERSVAAAAKAAGQIDVFVAAAGVAPMSATLKTPRTLWDTAIAVNLTGVYVCAQSFSPGMIERGWRRFIGIASTALFRAYPYAGAYAAAKHGVLGWIRTLALEHAKRGVAFNAVASGFSDTPLTADALEMLAAKSGGDGNA